MTSKPPPGWPALWDWFGADDMLNDLQLMEPTQDNKELLELAKNVITLPLEPAKFISEYLQDNESNPPAYKDILFGFNSLALLCCDRS
jgi:hypothetical protein